MRYYAALVRKDADGGFAVSFPDFPGCVSAGSTLAEASPRASERCLAIDLPNGVDEELSCQSASMKLDTRRLSLVPRVFYAFAVTPRVSITQRSIDIDPTSLAMFKRPIILDGYYRGRHLLGVRAMQIEHDECGYAKQKWGYQDQKQAKSYAVARFLFTRFL